VITDTFIQYIVADQMGTPLKVDMVKNMPVHFGDPVLFANVWVDSMENIGFNKILAVFGRTEAKDFIDLTGSCSILD